MSGRMPTGSSIWVRKAARAADASLRRACRNKSRASSNPIPAACWRNSSPSAATGSLRQWHPERQRFRIRISKGTDASMKANDTNLQLPAQQVSIDVLLEKYAKDGERSIEDVRRRVARALAAVEADPGKWEPLFLEALENGFIPGGRINSAAGTALSATLINCFVQPVGDSVSEVIDGKPGIYVALMEAAETMRRGG